MHLFLTCLVRQELLTSCMQPANVMVRLCHIITASDALLYKVCMPALRLHGTVRYHEVPLYQGHINLSRITPVHYFVLAQCPPYNYICGA